MRILELVATQTLTFMFTDIEGSTAMLQRLGDAYAGALAEHHLLIRAGLAAHGGEEVVAQGDGFFAVFASPRACVDAAPAASQCGRTDFGGDAAAGWFPKTPQSRPDASL